MLSELNLPPGTTLEDIEASEEDGKRVKALPSSLKSFYSEIYRKEYERRERYEQELKRLEH